MSVEKSTESLNYYINYIATFHRANSV